MFIRPSSSSGVTFLKNGMNSGFWNTTPRYAEQLLSLSVSITSRHFALG